MVALFRNLKLRTKLIASVLTVSFVVLMTIIVFTHIWYQDELKKEGIGLLQITSQCYAGEIEKLFGESVSISTTLANTLGQMVASQGASRKLAGDIIKNETYQQTRCESFWAMWEQDAFDGSDSEFVGNDNAYSNEVGRFTPSFYRLKGQVRYSPITEEIIKNDESYSIAQRTRKQAIDGPVLYTYEEGDPPVKIVTVYSPIILNGKYLGVSGADISLIPFEKALQGMKLYDGGYAQIINDAGIVVLHPDTALIEKPFFFEGNNYTTPNIITDITAGKEQIIYTNIHGKNYYYVFEPIIVTGIDTPWSLCIIVPEESLMTQASHIAKMSSLLFFPGILLLLVCVILVVNTIIRPINGANRVLTQLSLGHISETEQLAIKNNDEIGAMSKAINALTKGLSDMLHFAKEIGQRNYAVEYHLLSEHDELGHEMVEMRNNLFESAEKEKQFKAEDERRSWVNHGLAEFSEILRNNSQNMETLTYQVISRLIKYLDANQGGLFVVNDEDPAHPYLELTANYAYERRRYIQKRIEPGEGLVGTCYQEGETIYMDDIPDSYVHITSGIGKANPRALVIVPLKVNDVIYGILEIASFKKIEAYQIDFLEKIGANTASTISTVKGNLHTGQLLEQSQVQAQRLSEQEEEMRQNMEEMQATQEEMYRKNQESDRIQKELSDTLAKMQNIQDSLEDEKLEIQSVMDAVDSVFMRITYDIDMTLLDINDACLEFHGTTRDKMVGIKLTDKMPKKDIPEFKKNWAKVLAGETFKGDGVRQTQNGDKHVWYMYSPIKDASGKVYKVLMLGRFLDDI